MIYAMQGHMFFWSGDAQGECSAVLGLCFLAAMSSELALRDSGQVVDVQNKGGRKRSSLWETNRGGAK